MVREERIRKAAKLKAARNAAKAAAHKHALKVQQEPKTEVTFG